MAIDNPSRKQIPLESSTRRRLGQTDKRSRRASKAKEGGSILIMVIAVIILLRGVMVALIGVSNRASLGTGMGTIVAAGLSLSGVVVALFAAEEVGSLLLLTGLASLVAGLKGLDLVRQVRNRSEPIS